MRRLLAIVLLLAFGSPLAAPLYAATSDPDAALPACCRAHGKHHCAMTHGNIGLAAEPGAPSLRTQACPMYPGASSLPEMASVLLSAPQAYPAQFRSDPAFAASHSPFAPKFSSAANPKRGPPSILS